MSQVIQASAAAFTHLAIWKSEYIEAIEARVQYATVRKSMISGLSAQTKDPRQNNLAACLVNDKCGSLRDIDPATTTKEQYLYQPHPQDGIHIPLPLRIKVTGLDCLVSVIIWYIDNTKQSSVHACWSERLCILQICPDILLSSQSQQIMNGRFKLVHSLAQLQRQFGYSGTQIPISVYQQGPYHDQTIVMNLEEILRVQVVNPIGVKFYNPAYITPTALDWLLLSCTQSPALFNRVHSRVQNNLRELLLPISPDNCRGNANLQELIATHLGFLILASFIQSSKTGSVEQQLRFQQRWHHVLPQLITVKQISKFDAENHKCDCIILSRLCRESVHSSALENVIIKDSCFVDLNGELTQFNATLSQIYIHEHCFELFETFLEAQYNHRDENADIFIRDAKRKLHRQYYRGTKKSKVDTVEALEELEAL